MPIMEGTRQIGTDTGGYPSQPDADAIIRSVDNELIQAMDLSVPLLTLVGGLSGGGEVNSFKYEWVNDDNWRRRLSSHGGLAATDTTAFTITGQAHRYPIGTLFLIESELVRIIAIVDANTVTVARAQQGTTAAIHASTVTVRVAGSSMHEGDNWIYRPTPTVTLPYNYCQMDHTALRNTWRRQSINLYGVTGAQEMSKLVTDTLAQKTVAIEGSLMDGQRFVGSGSQPAAAGGIKYYATSANGADVTAKTGASIQWADFYNLIDRLSNNVGEENVSGGIFAVDPWTREKIRTFFAGQIRTDQSVRVGGSVIDELIIQGLSFKIVTIRSWTGTAECIYFHPNNVKVVHLGSTGLLHVGEVMQNDGPFSGMYVYSDHGFKIKNIPTMGRIHGHSLTT